MVHILVLWEKNEIAKLVAVPRSFTEATFDLIAYIISNEPHTKSHVPRQTAQENKKF